MIQFVFCPFADTAGILSKISPLTSWNAEQGV